MTGYGIKVFEYHDHVTIKFDRYIFQQIPNFDECISNILSLSYGSWWYEPLIQMDMNGEPRHHIVRLDIPNDKAHCIQFILLMLQPTSLNT